MDKSSIPTRDFNMVRDCYDDCIAFLDEQLDRLLNELERRGVLENTVVVITSDHGEGFGDHGICGHAYSVFMEEVGVPLVILAPGTPRGRADYHPVSLRDLPATVVDLLGLAEGTPFPGRSLAECWRSSPDRPEERLTSPAFSEQANEAAFEPQPDEPRGKHGFQMSLVTPDGIQYIRTGTGVEIIFNLWTDPRGLINLAGTPEGDALLGPLRASLLEVLSESRGTDKVEAAYLADYRRELANLVRDQELSRIAAPRSAAARQGSSRRSGPVREPVDATSATASGAFR
jgi:arylsulfatase A-like enzyme